MSAAEILVKFFRFYGYTISPESHAVDISQLLDQQTLEGVTRKNIEATLFSGASICDRYRLLDFLKSRLQNEDHTKYLDDEFRIEMKEQIDEEQKTGQSERYKVNRTKLIEYTNEFIDKSHGHLYLVLDPFNHTYNPAKAVAKNTSLYPRVFQDALG